MPPMMPGVSPGVPATDMLAMSQGSPAAGPGTAGPMDMSGAIEQLRGASQPMMDFFKSQPALTQQMQAFQNILRDSLMTLASASGVQTPSGAAVPMAGQ